MTLGPCHGCEKPSIAIVGSHLFCADCGMVEQRRLVLKKTAFLFGEDFVVGAYVRIIYKVGPRYPDAKRFGRIIEAILKMGPDDYRVGMQGQGPYLVFNIRLEDGTFETQHPEHLAITFAPKFKAVS